MDLEGEDLLWSRSCAGIFLEGLEKKNPQKPQDIWCVYKDSNWAPAEHLFRALQY